MLRLSISEVSTNILSNLSTGEASALLPLLPFLPILFSYFLFSYFHTLFSYLFFVGAQVAEWLARRSLTNAARVRFTAGDLLAVSEKGFVPV